MDHMILRPVKWSPAIVVIDGVPWKLDTDGRSGFLSCDPPPSLGPARDGVQRTVRQWIAAPGKAVKLADLHRFLQEAMPQCATCENRRALEQPVMRECSTCEGDGCIDCPHCGQDIVCSTCEGRKDVPTGVRAVQPCRTCSLAVDLAMVRFGEHCYNARLLLPVLAAIPADLMPDKVELSLVDQTLCLRAPQWALVVICLDPTRVDVSQAPAFEALS